MMPHEFIFHGPQLPPQNGERVERSHMCLILIAVQVFDAGVDLLPRLVKGLAVVPLTLQNTSSDVPGCGGSGQDLNL